ncbi:MAG: TIR domain-containing protein [Candidatus Sedimenticola sp. (ex Thyasira tokunagai)]
MSYYHGDQLEVDTFVHTFGRRLGIFTPVMLNPGQRYGTSIIGSTDTDYVMQQIRSRHFGHSTVSIVLLGSCTHSRRYVDWETKASLQRGGSGGELPHGLMAIALPSTGGSAYIPERFLKNWVEGNTGGYARFYRYPQNGEEVRSWIEDAYSARTARSHLIVNPNEMWKNNRVCEMCGITH